MLSLILSIIYKNQDYINLDDIKNYEFMFRNPDMTLETKIIGLSFYMNICVIKNLF